MNTELDACIYHGDPNCQNCWHWPFVIAIEDCYVPEFAPLIIEAAAEYDLQTCGLVFALAGIKAREEWCRN